MSYDPDALLDRRRLKRRLRIWQGVTILAVVAGVLVFLQSTGNLVRGDYIARIYVDDIILRDDARSDVLEDLAADDNVRGVIVHIDSPGGSVVGGEDLYKNILEVGNNKPVVAVMGTVATSAAYMASIAADHVLAREGTVTGSIGVIMQTANINRLLDDIGVEPVTIKSSDLKATPSPFEPLTEEAREASRAVVLDMYEFFVDLVIARRPIPETTVRAVSDGRVFSGRQALENGLIDGIGNESDALAWMQAERDVPPGLPVETVRDHREDDSLLEELTGLSGKSLFSNALTLDGLVSLWQPAAR